MNQEYFLRSKCGMSVGLTTLPPSCNDCLEMWEPQTPGTLMACPDLYGDCCTFTEMANKILTTVQNTK
jgi:hypothetical protein